MTLSGYRGPANSPDIFPYLVGEHIVGAFRDVDGGHGQIVLILESGHSLVVNDNGAYWQEDERDTRGRVQKRRRELESRLLELRLLSAGVPALA